MHKRILHALVIVPLLLGFVVDSTPAATVSPASSVSVSPDPGRLLPALPQAVGATDASIGQSVRDRMILGLGRITSVAVSPDGKKALLGSDAGFVTLVDLVTGDFDYFFGHAGQVNAVAFSPNGSRVLTGSDDGTARLWNTTTGALVAVFSHSRGVNAVAFSPDGSRVLTGCADNTARLWNASTGELVRTFSGHIYSVAAVAFSPDGSKVLTGSMDNTARLWDAATGTVVRTFSGHTGGVTAVAFSPDGSKIITGSDDGTARLWNASTGAVLCSLTGHTAAVTSVAYSPDSNNPMVATASQDGTARLWDANCGAPTLLHTLSGHTSSVNAVAFSPDGSEVLTGSADRTARMWDTSTGQNLLVLSGHTDAVVSAVFSPDGSMVLTGSRDSAARLWDVESGRLVRTFVSHNWGLNAVAFSPDGSMILTGGDDNAAQLWNAANGALVREFTGHTGPVVSVAFSPDGSKMLTGSEDQTARVWDLNTGQTMLTITQTTIIRDATFSPDGSKILLAAVDQNAYLYDANTGALISTLAGHTDSVLSGVFSPDGSKVLTGGEDQTIRLWDASTGQQVRVFSGVPSSMDAVAFSPDGNYVIGGGSSGEVGIWDAATGTLLQVIRGHTDQIYAIDLTPDGRWILTASGDATARLWKFGVATLERTIDLQGVLPLEMAFSPDGSRLLIGCDDATATLWDVDSGQRLRTLAGHDNNYGISAIAFAPDGSQALTGSGDGTARLWDLSTGQVVRVFNQGSGVTSVAFSPDGSRVATGDVGGQVWVWNTATGQTVNTFTGLGAKVDYVSFTHDGSQLLTWASGSEVRLWELSTGQVVRTFGIEVSSVALSPDGSRVLTGTGNGVAYLWDTNSGQLLHVFQSGGPAHPIQATAFAASGRLAFVADALGMYLWDVFTGELILAVGDNDPLLPIAASTSATVFARYCDKGTSLWSFEWQPWGGRQATALTLGVAAEGSVARYDWSDYYALPGASGQPLLVTATPLTGTNSLALYARRGQLPTLSGYDYRVAEPTAQGNYELLIYPTQNITYYLGVFGKSVDVQGHFRIVAQTVARHLADVSPRSAGNAGDVTLNIRGLGFVDGMQVELRGPATLQAVAVNRLSSTTLVARFNLRGASTGTYDLYAIWPGGAEEHLNDLFSVRSGSGASLTASLGVLTAYRLDTISPVAVNYANVGDADMPAPLLIVSTSPNVSMRAACHTSWHNGPIYLLGVNPVALAGTLAPGASGSLPLSFIASSNVTFTLESVEATDTAVNWDSYKDAMRPAQMSEADWNSIWPTLTQRLGNTWGDYLRVLGGDAERLRQRRQINYCVDDLLFMEVKRARGEPTAAIVGQVINADTKEPLGGVSIVAYQITTTAGTTPTVRAELSDLLDGYFVVDGLPSGRYRLLAEGYYFTPTVTVEITNDQDVTGLTLLAHPVELEEKPTEEVLEVPDHKPSLVADGSGNVHMVWQRGEEIWHSTYSNGAWTNTLPISGAVGVEPDVVFASNLIGTSSSGLIVVWQEGYSNTAHLRYSLGRPDANGVYSWTLPLTLTDDNYGDIAPVVVITGTQTPLMLWLQRDWSIEDDFDLYYTQVNTIPVTALVWTRGEYPGTSQGVAGVTVVPMAEHCLSILLRKGNSLPKWVPLIGGRYGFEIKGKGCVEPGCDPAMSAGLELEVEFTERVSGSGSATVTGAWNTDPKSCRYVFDSAEVGLAAGGSAQVPVWTPPLKIPGVTVEIGGSLSGELSGVVGWKGANFPRWPDSGAVDLTLAAAPYGTVNLFDVVEATLEGSGSVTGRYVPPRSLTFVGWCLSVSAEAKVWIITYSWSKEWGPCTGDAAVMRALEAAGGVPATQAMVFISTQTSDGVPNSESLVVKVEPLTGTGHIYGGTPVLSATIGSDLTHDGKAAVARSSSGEILAAWTKDSPDPNTATGSSVVVSSYDGNGWSAPVKVQSADFFNRHTAMVFDSSDVPMLLWASAQATVTLSSPVTDVLDAIDNADIYFSRRVTSTWSAPAAVATLPGKDEDVRVAADAVGNVVAAWINTTDDFTDTIYTAFWNGSAWSTPVTIPVTGTVNSLDVAYAGSNPLLVWSQDTDGDRQTRNDVSLFHSTWDGSKWSSPVRMPKPQATVQGAQVTAADNVGAQWLPPFSPPKDCCDQDDDDDKPKPPDPPKPPKKEEDKKPAQMVRPVDPNEKSGPQGIGAQRLIGTDETLQYTVYFENVVTATAPAQQVVVVDYLSPYLDWSTFRFEEVAFGDHVISISDEGYQVHLRQAIADYRLTENKEWLVDISGEVNPFTGRVQWTFRTLDPTTGEAPSDPLAGFLPPNDDTGRGEGHVRFSVRPKEGVVPGTRISNSARIVFDNYETIETNEVWNIVAYKLLLPIVRKNQ